jgi:hypothetical protein
MPGGSSAVFQGLCLWKMQVAEQRTSLVSRPARAALEWRLARGVQSLVLVSDAPTSGRLMRRISLSSLDRETTVATDLSVRAI